MGGVLYRYLNRSQEAITRIEQAIAVLVETGLPQDAAGHTRDDRQQYPEAMLKDIGHIAMLAAQIQQIVTNTVAVMTTVQESRTDWREVMTKALHQAKGIHGQ